MKNIYAMMFASLLVLSVFSFALVSADNNSREDQREMMKKAQEKFKEDQQRLREQAKELRDLRDNERNGNNNQNDDDDDSLSADELSLSVNDSDIEDSYEKLAKEDKLKKIGFAEVLRGQGWATSNNEGALLSIVFLQQSFAEYNKTSNTTSDFEIKRSIGHLLSSVDGNYDLILSDNSNDSMNFYLVANGKEVNFTNPSENSLGTLTLTKVSEFSNVKTWNGELNLNNKTWSVNIATDTNTFKGKPNINEGKKVGFWKRLMFWNKN